MAEFLQIYSIWIFFGLLFSLMLWGRARGHCVDCCGDRQHAPETIQEKEAAEIGKTWLRLSLTRGK